MPPYVGPGLRGVGQAPVRDPPAGVQDEQPEGALQRLPVPQAHLMPPLAAVLHQSRLDLGRAYGGSVACFEIPAAFKLDNGEENQPQGGLWHPRKGPFRSI